MSYQKGYLGIPGFDHSILEQGIQSYLAHVFRYIDRVNPLCNSCNNLGMLEDYVEFSCGLIRYGSEYLARSYDNPNLFIVIDDQIPRIIREAIDIIYKDLTTDTATGSFNISGECQNNILGFYLDSYGVLTRYDNIAENRLYNVMGASDKKKFRYRQYLWAQQFTYQSKRNCSCKH